MKRIITIGLMLIFMLSFCSGAQTVFTKSDEFRIDLVKYDPSPVQPGEISELTFEITNLADYGLENFEISLVDNFPFSLANGSAKQIFESLDVGEKLSFVFPVNVNENVADGFYTLNLQYYSERKGAYVSQPFTIYVQRANRVVSATSITVVGTGIENIPGGVSPGEIGQVKVSVKNSANYLMKDISVKLKLNDSSTPFAPIGSTAQKNIMQISSGHAEEVVFDIIALPDAEAGVYKVNMDIEYYDELGNKYTRNDLIGIVISAEPKFFIEVKDNTFVNKRSSGEVTLNFVNVGLTKVKFFTLKLEESDAYKILSEDDVYLGDIDPDDDDSVSFTLKLNSDTNTIILPVTLSFLDANNQRYIEEYDVELEVYNKKKNSGVFGAFILIVFILIIVGVIKRKKIMRMLKSKDDKRLL